MFEHWSERRRRWFLITFCSVAWALFLNGIAHLGDSTVRGGVGADAVHLAAALGSAAVIMIAIGAVRLALRHWMMAVLFGVSLHALIVDIGFKEHVAAGVWSIECDRLDAAACAQLGDYYASGRSIMHGWTDAELMHRRACSLGHADSCPLISEFAQRSCAEGGRSDCLREAREFTDRGQYLAAARAHVRACALTDRAQGLEPCVEAMNSGHHDLRLAACETVELVCRTSSQQACGSAVPRCDRARSPHAGVR